MSRETTDILIDDAVEKVQSTLSRTVATRLVPALTLGLVPAAAWLQAKIGIDLNSTELSVYIGSSIVAIGGAAIAYIRARLQGVYALHAKLIDRGIDAVEQSKEELTNAKR